MPRPRLKVRSISAGSTPVAAINSKTGCGPPGRPIDIGGQVRRQHPGDVRCDSAAGDMGECMGVGVRGEIEAVAGIDARRFEQFRTDRAAEGVDMWRCRAASIAVGSAPSSARRASE